MDDLFLGGSKKREKNFQNSSTILRAEYNSATRRLVVLFVGGNTYQYQGVPEEVVNEFFNAESPGKYLNEQIKKGAYTTIKL